MEDRIIGYDDLDENNSQSEFEEMVSQMLLVELFNAKKAEVFENVVFEGKKRYYIEDLTERDYRLENTTPYQLEILGHAIEETSWTHLLEKVAKLLLDIFPQKRVTIIDFRCPWSKAAMFSTEPRTNFREVTDGLYVNCNHTALHACWFLQDMLDFFEVDKAGVSFLIHRPSSAEPQKVKDYIEKRFKKGFVNFLISRYGLPDERAEKIIDNIDKYLNPILCSISKSYTNFFLFDDNAVMANYIKKTKERIAMTVRFSDKAKLSLNRYLDWLVQYYKEK